MAGSRNYWFPAKRHGWGWGMPRVWQGKAVLTAFFVLIGIGAPVLLREYGNTFYVLYCLLLTGALVLLCWAKGEPPKWRWGKD